MISIGSHICVLTTNRVLAQLVASIHNANTDYQSKTVTVVAAHGSWALQRDGISYYYALVDWKNLKVVGWESEGNRPLSLLSGPWTGDGA